MSGGKVFGPGGAAEILDVKPTTLLSRMKVLAPFAGTVGIRAVDVGEGQDATSSSKTGPR